jgi:hypothetical protein
MTTMKEFMKQGLAAELGVTQYDFDPETVAEGIKVEMEHTDDPEIAMKITLDHLAENERYYAYLEVMERVMKEHENE